MGRRARRRGAPSDESELVEDADRQQVDVAYRLEALPFRADPEVLGEVVARPDTERQVRAVLLPGKRQAAGDVLGLGFPGEESGLAEEREARAQRKDADRGKIEARSLDRAAGHGDAGKRAAVAGFAEIDPGELH